MPSSISALVHNSLDPSSSRKLVVVGVAPKYEESISVDLSRWPFSPGVVSVPTPRGRALMILTVLGLSSALLVDGVVTRLLGWRVVQKGGSGLVRGLRGVVCVVDNPEASPPMTATRP